MTDWLGDCDAPDAPATIPDAVLFDLDGTLVDSIGDLTIATDRMLSDLALPAAGEARVRRWVGRGVRELVRDALSRARDQEPSTAELEEALAVFSRHYETVNGLTTRPYAGADELVAGLRARGVALAVVTNKTRPFTLTILRAAGWLDHFAAVVCGDDTPARKPDPTPVQEALSRVGVTAQAALMIGDSDYDVIAARGAGVPVWRVSQGYGPPGLTARADAELATLEDVLDRLVGSSARR
jgi:phosphoglycolate phosphatase